MPPRIFTILGRLRQVVAAAISPEAIRAARAGAGYHWRRRKLGPVETVYLFLLQVLHEGGQKGTSLNGMNLRA